MKSVLQFLIFLSLMEFGFVTQACADVSPGCDAIPQSASSMGLLVMLGVMGIAMFLVRRQRLRD